jgi:hypothetical protein
MKDKLPLLNDKQLQAGIDEFIAKLAQLEQDRVELCKFLAKLVDHNRFTLRYINRMCPKLSVPKLKLMERVGRGDFHPALLDAVTPGECMLAKMDYQEQVRGIEEDGTVPIVTMDKDGNFGMTLLPIRSLTYDQVNQISRVVGGKRVYISEDEQKAWLVDHRTNLATRPSLKADQPKWVIVDGNVVILRKNTKLTPLDLGNIWTDVLAAVHSSTRPIEHPPKGPDKGPSGNDNPPEGPGKGPNNGPSGVTNPPKPVAPKTPRKSSQELKAVAANANHR